MTREDDSAPNVAGAMSGFVGSARGGSSVGTEMLIRTCAYQSISNVFTSAAPSRARRNAPKRGWLLRT